MADNINEYALSSALAPFVQAQMAMAMRPQKSLQETNTISNTVPYALQDMLNARNTISNSTNELEKVLKLRESPWYATLKALGEVRGSSEPGKWLESGLRGLSTGYTSLDDIKAENAKLLRDARLEDLTQRLAYDKAMGEKQTQYQRQDIDYKEMPWGGAGGKSGGQGGPDQVVQNIATATGEGMDPEEFIKQYNTGGFIESGASDVDAQDNPTLIARFIRSAVAPTNTGARSALSQNMTDKIIAPKIQNMIQNMGGARGADTLREVSTRIGPLAQITSLGTQEQLGAISAAKTDVLDIINRDRRAVGMQPLTMEQFQPAWNKLFTGIATYHKQYGEKKSSKKEKQTVTQPVEAQEDYSKYGF